MSATTIAVHSSSGGAAYVAMKHHDEECLKVIQSYDSKIATVEEMQAYSGCVQRLYPNTMHHEMLVPIKVLIVFSFILWAVISWVNREHSDSWGEAILVGFSLAFFVSLIIIAVFALISFLFM